LGQKAHPYGLRLGYIKGWKSKWYSKRDYARFLHEDIAIRKYIKDSLKYAGISSIEIERSAGKVRVRIFTARPGIIIGRRGQEIDKMKDELSKITPDEIIVDIKEIKIPQMDAQLVAENIAMQLEKRVAFRRAMKKAVSGTMGRGAGGIKVMCGGRLGGAEIARTEGYKEGKVPLNTFRANVEYGATVATTTYGIIGVKVWLYKGDVLIRQQEAEEAKEREVRFKKKMKRENFKPSDSGQKDSKSSVEKAEKEVGKASVVTEEKPKNDVKAEGKGDK